MPDGPQEHLSLLSSTRQALLTILKRDGTVTAEELARQVHISTSAARQQLVSLEHMGLVSHYDERNGPGRPRRHFQLTVRGDGLFPQLHVDLARVMLSTLQTQSADVQEQMDAGMAAALFGPGPSSDVITEVIANAERVLARRGFDPNVTPVRDSVVLVTLGNCPMLDLAEEFPSVCETELRGLKQVMPGCSVNRVQHRLAEDRHCVYQVSPS